LTDDFLRPEDIARLLRLGQSTVYRALESGEIPGEKVCGRWRTLRSQLVDRVRDGRTPKSRAASDPMPRARRGAGRFREKVVDLDARRAAG
jgi:excisionase family DNA binding protein